MDVLLFALAHPRWEFVFQPIYEVAGFVCTAFRCR
jgi:hypothetical protein